MKGKRMKITCMAGVSGVGKTWKRTNDPILAALPFLDIADIYVELEADDSGYVVADWNSAMIVLIDRIVEHKQSGTKHLVVEGYFLPGTPSRKWLADACKVQGIDIEYQLLWAPLKVCAERLYDQFDALSDEEQNRQRHSFNKRHELLIKCWKPQ